MADAPTVTSRCLTFAEGAVTMVSPVLLALALKKDKWETDVGKPDVPMEWLAAFAGATLFTGIFPTLACCASVWFPTWVSVSRLSDIRGYAATLSSLGLVFIAGCISYVGVVSKKNAIIFGALSLFLLLHRVCTRPGDQELPEADADRRNAKKMLSMVDKSHEFISGITGILFLGLEGMALEGFVSAAADRERLCPHMTICSAACASGVYMVFLLMFPPLIATSASVHFAMHVAEIVMAIFTVGLSTIVVITLMKKRRGQVIGFLVLLMPFVMLLYLVIIIIKNRGEEEERQRHQDMEMLQVMPADEDEAKPAPMGLIKVIFTGFFFVSVKAISGDSYTNWTLFFLLVAAAAIDCGVFWRLLTHVQNKVRVGGNATAAQLANFASFFTHLFVAVAAGLFALEAWNAAKDQSADCAYVSNVTCVHLNKTILHLPHAVRNMCTCIISNRSLSTGSFHPCGN